MRTTGAYDPTWRRRQRHISAVVLALGLAIAAFVVYLTLSTPSPPAPHTNYGPAVCWILGCY